VLTDPTLRTSLLGRKYDLAMANIVADVISPLSFGEAGAAQEGALSRVGDHRRQDRRGGKGGGGLRFQIKEKLCENDWVSTCFLLMVFME
jgi:hypothetical protein